MAAFDIRNFKGPPRSVPLLLRLRLLFGGFLSQFGWLFFGFGLIFVWAFTANMNIKDWRALRGDVESTQGTVTKIERHTSRSGRHGRHRKTTWWYYYTFKGPDGEEYTGVSHGNRPVKVDDEVTVKFPKGRPEISRIEGLKSFVTGPEGLIPLVFPVVGLVFIMFGFKKGLKANRLLADGELGKGRLKSREKTNTKINKQPVYKLTFEFSNSQGTSYEVSVKTHLPEKLEDQQEEPLLYEPMNPKNAVMLDDLPGSPRIDENGNIRAGSPSAALLSFVIPFIVIIGHGTYIYIRFLS